MKKKLIILVIMILACLLSIFVISPNRSKPENYKGTIKALNKKQTTVLEMTAAATTASLALGAVPGDATTPVANKVIDMAGYFIIILAVVILEKYMLTIGGYLAFTWLVPIALLLLAASMFVGARFGSIFRQLAAKLLVFALAVVLIVPVSVKLTEIIEKTNEVSISTTLDNMKKFESKSEESTTQIKEENSRAEKEATGPLDYISGMKSNINQMVEDAKEAINDSTSTLSQLSQEAIEKAKDTINDFVEIVVIMLVTTCGIPILTVMLFIWIMKTLMGVDLSAFINIKDNS